MGNSSKDLLRGKLFANVLLNTLSGNLSRIRLTAYQYYHHNRGKKCPNEVSFKA